ncbi:MAG: hypothetical protein E5W81_31980, partial [Mesorhizobium sp.]
MKPARTWPLRQGHADPGANGRCSAKLLAALKTRGKYRMKRPLEPSAEGRGRVVGITDGVFAIALTL